MFVFNSFKYFVLVASICGENFMICFNWKNSRILLQLEKFHDFASIGKIPRFAYFGKISWFQLEKIPRFCFNKKNPLFAWKYRIFYSEIDWIQKSSQRHSCILTANNTTELALFELLHWYWYLKLSTKNIEVKRGFCLLWTIKYKLFIHRKC